MEPGFTLLFLVPTWHINRLLGGAKNIGLQAKRTDSSSELPRTGFVFGAAFPTSLSFPEGSRRWNEMPVCGEAPCPVAHAEPLALGWPPLEALGVRQQWVRACRPRLLGSTAQDGHAHLSGQMRVKSDSKNALSAWHTVRARRVWTFWEHLASPTDNEVTYICPQHAV